MCTHSKTHMHIYIKIHTNIYTIKKYDLHIHIDTQTHVYTHTHTHTQKTHISKSNRHTHILSLSPPPTHTHTQLVDCTHMHTYTTGCQLTHLQPQQVELHDEQGNVEGNDYPGQPHLQMQWWDVVFVHGEHLQELETHGGWPVDQRGQEELGRVPDLNFVVVDHSNKSPDERNTLWDEGVIVGGVRVVCIWYESFRNFNDEDNQ